MDAQNVPVPPPAPPSLMDLAAIGSEQLARMATAGELRGRHLWVAFRGAQRYKAAIGKGDIAGEECQRARAGTCDGCPSAHRHPMGIAAGAAAGAVAIFCGPPFEEHEGTSPTCGCLVALTVEGETHAAGRGVVASLGCVQGRWKATTAATV